MQACSPMIDPVKEVSFRAAEPVLGWEPGHHHVWCDHRDLAVQAEVGMAARRQWSDLSGRTRRLLAITAAAEGVLKLAALIDLKRRPASQVRGRKWVWATVVTVVSSAGVVPISYFLFGRRQPP
jgi:hypothetical protein